MVVVIAAPPEKVKSTTWRRWRCVAICCMWRHVRLRAKQWVRWRVVLLWSGGGGVFVDCGQRWVEVRVRASGRQRRRRRGWRCRRRRHIVGIGHVEHLARKDGARGETIQMEYACWRRVPFECYFLNCVAIFHLVVQSSGWFYFAFLIYFLKLKINKIKYF